MSRKDVVLNTLLATLMMVSQVSIAAIPVGTELQYNGTLSQHVKGSPVEAKSLSVVAVVLKELEEGFQVAWNVEERGGGGWAWPERFGTFVTNSSGAATTGEKSKFKPIRLLHTHDGTQYPLMVRSPVFEFRDKLAAESVWSDGRLEYRVTRKRKVKDRDCWQIETASNIGRAQTMIVEASTGILVSLDERVFMGRGDEFQLKIELVAQKTLPSADLEKSQMAFETLSAMQAGLARTGDQKVVELTDVQLKLVSDSIGRIEKQSEGTAWSKLASVISKDLVQQQRRLEGVAGLEKKFVGQPAPSLSLKQANGTPIPEAELKDKVVVLHFWEYRGDPLSEPYGQVGYLDFLSNKRKKLGAKVIGVNVDPRFADKANAGGAARSQKKLQEFMNLGYDIAADDGALLTQFGDPRTLGSPLPLWIVIGHDGKILHYHIGFYDIRPDEGLKQLDEAVIDALRRQKAK